LNGGIRSLDTARAQLEIMDGIMIGREAYQNPWFLAEVENALLGGEPPVSRLAVVEAMLDYAQAQLAAGARLHSITRHMLGLFAGQPGARAWRRMLSENAIDVIEAALEACGRRSAAAVAG
ncbi:MAG: tRNA-dihydrouridine synthase A, partial [Gammaproteobacteria bacterium SG8_31]